MNNEFDLTRLVEVVLEHDDDFLKVRETLTRIGVASKRNKTLFQSCHILHKRGKFYIVHFKELFALDGKPTNFDENDVRRRNTIARLLAEWGLVKVVRPEQIADQAMMSQVKIIPYSQKEDWELIPKYQIGKSSSYNTQNTERKFDSSRLKDYNPF
jgi:hypothetical protein